LVDAFASERFTGNPAGVVLDGRGLDGKRMQRIAAEIAATATAFALPGISPDARFGLRWFSPQTELGMCGHGTIAAVHALVESGRLAGLLDSPQAAVVIETAAGLLRASCERLHVDTGRFVVWLELPAPKLTPKPVNPVELARLLGMSSDRFERDLPIMKTQDQDLIVFVADLPTLGMALPDFRALGDWCRREGLRGVLLSTLNTVSRSITTQSRYFAPAVGIEEDPVTGSVHGPLGVYLVANELAPVMGHVAAINCVQGISGGRTGLIRVLVRRHPGRGYSVRIAGECRTTVRGKLLV
jgi:trans-2,3-dihydro-3-hydroxyanthranilate isomerase